MKSRLLRVRRRLPRHLGARGSADHCRGAGAPHADAGAGWCSGPVGAGQSGAAYRPRVAPSDCPQPAQLPTSTKPRTGASAQGNSVKPSPSAAVAGDDLPGEVVTEMAPAQPRSAPDEALPGEPVGP